MLAGPLDQLVQLVLDTELVGLRVPNLLRRRDEALSRQSLEDLLDSFEAQASRFHEHRDCLLHVAHLESLVENPRFRAVDEDGRQGPGRFVLDLHVSIHHDAALFKSLEFIPMYIGGRRAANGMLCSPLLV